MFKRNLKKFTMVLATLVMANMLIHVQVQADSTQTVTGVVTDCNSGKPIDGVIIKFSKNGNPNSNYDTGTSNSNGEYSVNIHNGAGDICVTKADGYDSYSTSLDNFTEYYNINAPIKDVINPHRKIINIKLKATSRVSIGVSINVTDSSNQSIAPYINTAGKNTNNILPSPVRLATDAKAKISYGFNDVTFSKYKFVEASNLTMVPQFPQDSAMTNIPLPEPNTYDAYKDDIGKQNYLTTKHYEYAGKAGTASARNVSFGTPSFDGVFEQEAVTDSTENPVPYDLGSTDGSNFYVSQKGKNTTSYGSPVKIPNANTITYNRKYYPKTKYASNKAMKMWGYFVPRQTGSYVLGCWSDDGAYGYIIKDGVHQVFVDDWSIRAPFDRNNGNSMELTAGKYYPIYMEWYEGCPTQAAFVPEYKFNDGAFVTIPENELYSSKTTTPGDIAGAYFGDVSGISFPAQDGIYYMATKFVSNEGLTSGLYGPFIIDNTKPVLNNLVVDSNNANSNKWAMAANTLTIKFTASENLIGNPQILINGYATNATITNDTKNNYTATVSIGSDGSINSNKDKLTDGPITVQVAHYADLYGNEGVAVQDSTVTYDNTAPTVTINYSANPIGQGTEIITAIYSEPVNVNDTPKITINKNDGTNLLQSQYMTIVGTDRKIWSYNYNINGIYNNVTAIVSLSQVHDSAGNSSNSTTSTFNIDTVKPTITLSFSADPVSVGTEIITANCSKTVVGTPKISINQPGTTDISNVNMESYGNNTWIYNYTVHADDNSNYIDGKATVQLDLTNVKDSVGNQALPPQANSFTIDTKPPTVAITYSANPVKSGVQIITATYSEPVKVGEIPLISIDQPGSVDITSQPMSALGTDGKTWTYNYTVNNDNGNTYRDGTAAVTLSTMHDAAGNVARTPIGNIFIIDTRAPIATIGTPSSTFTKSGPIMYTVTYSGADKVILNSSNVTLVKTGTADGTVTASGTGNTRIVTVSNITGDGTLGIRIAAGTASDIAGNSATAPLDSTTFAVWNSPPRITLTPNTTISTNANIIITVVANAVGSGNVVVERKWLAGTKTLVDFTASAGTVISGNTFSVSSNGDYTVYARDIVGNTHIESITIGNIDKSIIKTGLFINNKFSEKVGNISIVRGFSTNLAFQITNLKNQNVTLEMSNTDYINISEVKVYSITNLKKPLENLNISISSDKSTFTITGLPTDKTDYVFVFKAKALKEGTIISDVIKINGFPRTEKHTINIVKLPPLQ